MCKNIFTQLIWIKSDDVHFFTQLLLGKWSAWSACLLMAYIPTSVNDWLTHAPPVDSERYHTVWYPDQLPMLGCIDNALFIVCGLWNSVALWWALNCSQVRRQTLELPVWWGHMTLVCVLAFLFFFFILPFYILID